MALEIKIETPDRQTRRVVLDRNEFTLGRAQTNDLSYPDDASLSRKHLRLEKQAGSWFAHDLRSKNGTLLNGAPIDGSHRLRSGDRVSVGQLTITFIDPDSEPTESVIFVPGSAPEMSPSATVMTSLEGVLSGHGPASAPRAEAERAFQLPMVRALIRAGRELAGHQPLEELFPLILELSIEAVGAERGVLMTLDGGDLVTRATHGEGFRISTMVRDRVLNEKTSLLVRNMANEEALLRQLSISEQQIQSLMAAPLQTENRVIGLIYVDSRLFVREFTPDDLNLLTVLANVAAIRIDHELHLQLQRQEQDRTRDLQQAAEIQRGILPSRPPQVAGLDVAGYNVQCRTVGGDYYDFIPHADGRLTVVLGDVAGKGMSAALLMSNLQARVQLLTEEPGDLATIMSRLDKALSINCPTNRFVTLFLSLIDPARGTITYCNAGHNPPMLVRATGQIERLKGEGTVLGVLPDLGYVQKEHALGPGDLVVLFSDGVTEAPAIGDGEEFGEERLAEIVARLREEPAAEIIEAVKQAVDAWAGVECAADDVTLVVLRRTR